MSVRPKYPFTVTCQIANASAVEETVMVAGARDILSFFEELVRNDEAYDIGCAEGAVIHGSLYEKRSMFNAKALAGVRLTILARLER